VELINGGDPEKPFISLDEYNEEALKTKDNVNNEEEKDPLA